MTVRRYQAIAVRCPACGANPERPCIDWDAKPMRGIHRRRDEAFNRQQFSESPEPTVGAQARGSLASTTTVRGLPIA